MFPGVVVDSGSVYLHIIKERKKERKGEIKKREKRR